MNFKISLFAAVAVCMGINLSAQVPATVETVIFEDNFDGPDMIPDTTKWSLCPNRHPDWARHLSESYDQIYVKDGNLVMVAEKVGDAYKTGGISTKGKFDFRYGKAEARMRFTKSADGGWPAFWLMPYNDSEVMWPNGGEIDIMERLSHDDIVYQTIHTHYKNDLGRENPQPADTVRINPEEYNVYGVEWTPEELRFLVNGEVSFVYPNLHLDNESEMRQWPYNVPFYIIFNQSLGGDGTWPGPIADEQLPIITEVDWVRVTQPVQQQ